MMVCVVFNGSCSVSRRALSHEGKKENGVIARRKSGLMDGTSTTSLFGAAQPRITSTAAFRSAATSDGEAMRILIVLDCAGIALRFMVAWFG
ncbi:MAG: hypothetical protein HGB15_05645 [Chlorobaculum sp.]|nr:hypothetical protein [Chlorobaculum sp.]